MNWFRLQKIFLAAVLVVANPRCVVACVAELCHDSQTNSGPGNEDKVPPCHRHQPSSQDKQPERCMHAAVLAEYRSPAAPEVVRVAPIVFLPVRNAPLAPSELTQRAILQETSPPSSPEL